MHSDWIRSCSRVAAVLSIAAVGCVGARAELVSEDYRSFGDGLLTFDTRTGLNWLDVGATLNRAPQDIWAGADGWLPSFRYATRSEVKDLFVSFGLSGAGRYVTTEKEAAQRFVDLFSNGPNDCGNFTCGVMLGDPGYLDIVNVGVVANDLYNGGFSYIWENNFADSHRFVGESWGSFLVLRNHVTPVPEPHAFLLAACGFAIVTFLHRRAKPYGPIGTSREPSAFPPEE